jgi:membrane-bound ClpP family serine protease
MVALGIGLLLVGATLLVAEAHLPTGGLLGVAGAAALVAGVVLAIEGSGAGLALAIPLAAGVGLAGFGFTAIAARKGAATRRLRSHSGPEGLVGQLGVARSDFDPSGQVFVDGALWRALRSWADDGDPLHPGDPVVVERVSGLTLSVRKAEDWELP